MAISKIVTNSVDSGVTLTSPVMNTITSAAATALTLQSAGTTAVTVDTSQNVGIGTSSPAAKLNVGRAGTIGVLTGVNAVFNADSNNQYGGIQINSYDDNTKRFAIINSNGITSLFGYGSNSSVNLGTDSAQPVLISTNNTERMRINTTGQMVMGGNTPYSSAKVTLIPLANPTTGTSNSSQIQIGEATGNPLYRLNIGYGLFGDYYGYIQSQNNGSANQLLLNPDGGDVIIGGTTATATARLNVYQADSSQRVVHFENTRNISSDENLRLVLGTNCNNTASYQFIVTTAGADKLYIYGNGNIVNTNNSYGALSDIKLKENIVDATPKLADLMQVRVRNYNLIGDSTKQIGVVAQELGTIFPAMVDESPDRDGEGGNLDTVTKSVKYSVFVPMLIKSIQELKAIIDTQATRITALEAK